MLKNQFKMELNVYSQDDTYSQSLKEVKNKLEEENKINKKSDIVTDNHATFRELMLHIESYYTVSKLSVISDQLKLKRISEKLPYLPHQIVSKRLADQIPLVICNMVLQEVAVALRRSMLQLLHDKDDVDNLLREDSDINRKRENTLSRQKRLKEASKLLATY